MDLAQTPIAAVMNVRVVSVTEGSPVRKAIRLVLQHEIAGLPVVDADQRLVGVISEKELLVHAACGNKNVPISYCHTPTATRGDATVKDVIVELVSLNRKWLPVIDEDRKLLGVIARRDILRALMENE